MDDDRRRGAQTTWDELLTPPCPLRAVMGVDMNDAAEGVRAAGVSRLLLPCVDILAECYSCTP